MIPHRTVLHIFQGTAEIYSSQHCNVECQVPHCSELAYDLWERMTFGGAKIEIYNYGSSSNTSMAPHMLPSGGVLRVTHWYDR